MTTKTTAVARVGSNAGRGHGGNERVMLSRRPAPGGGRHDERLEQQGGAAWGSALTLLFASVSPDPFLNNPL